MGNKKVTRRIALRNIWGTDKQAVGRWGQVPGIAHCPGVHSFNEYLIWTSLCQAQKMERRKVSVPSSHENAQDRYCTCMSGCVRHHYAV